MCDKYLNTKLRRTFWWGAKANRGANRVQTMVNTSYIDDVACLVVGDSEEENCKELEAVATTAFEWGDNNAVAFDDPKTELIYFHR